MDCEQDELEEQARIQAYVNGLSDDALTVLANASPDMGGGLIVELSEFVISPAKMTV